LFIFGVNFQRPLTLANMTNWDLLEFIWFVCNKEQYGDSFTAADFNKLAPIVQQQFYDDERSQYERTQIVTNVIERMKVALSPDMAINSNGISDLPANYYYWSNCIYPQTIGSNTYHRPVSRVTDGEYADRIGSSIVMPTSQYPICLIRGGKIQFEPLRSTYVKFNYLRYPTKPFIDYYIDENLNQIYKEAGATSAIIIKGDIYSQISNLVLTGITEDNSDYFSLYWKITLNISTLLYEFNIYKDTGFINKVAYATTTVVGGSVTINEYANSGISGSATLAISTIDITEDGTSFLDGVTLINNNYTRLYYSIYYNIALNKSFLKLYSNYNKTTLVSTGSLTGYVGSTISMIGLTGNAVLTGNILSISPSSDDYLSNIFITGMYGSNNISIEYEYSLATKALIISVYKDADLICYFSFSNFLFGTTVTIPQNNSSGYSTSALINVKKEGDAYNQISAIELSGIASTNSNLGDIYYDINSVGINLYSHYNSEYSLYENGLSWCGLCQSPINSDIYSCVFGGDIYRQAGGIGSFAPLSQTSRNWRGLCSAPNGDIYACVLNGDIYKQTGGTGNFMALSQTSRAWNGLCSAPNGDIYACVLNGDIYKQTGGTGNFIALSQTARYWNGLCSAPNGDIYACVSGGDIYKQTGGTGNFMALSQTSRAWSGLSADSSGNIYACVTGVGIYKQTGGTGNFILLRSINRSWIGILSTLNDVLCGCVQFGYIHANINYPDLRVAYIVLTNGIVVYTNNSGLSGNIIGSFSTPVVLSSSSYLDFSSVSTLQTLTSTYVNGNMSLGNYVDFNQDNSDDNVITSVTESETVEMEWRDEDKIRIAGRMIEAIGLNLKDNSILQYAQQFKLPVR